MSARTALVTGATSGLGREVALRLARSGDRVLVHGRDAERGRAVVRRIENETPGSASFHRADFAELDRVRALADEVLEVTDRLDVLVNNAGIYKKPEGRAVSADGYELRLQVNHLAHFLLTLRLLPLIRASAPARIVNVASGAQSPVEFSDPMLESGFTESRAYGQSKLAQILFNHELAHRLDDDEDVAVNALHPATYMDTKMVREAGVRPRSSVDEGADGVLHLIEDDVGTGGYFEGTEPSVAHPQAYDVEARRRLWELSAEWVGLE